MGRSFAFALKEAIRRSQSFALVDDDALPADPRIVVHLVSVDVDNPNPKGISSAISVTIVYDSLQTLGSGIFITASVTHCGRDRVESCAKNTLPDIDSAVEHLRKSWPNLWKNL